MCNRASNHPGLESRCPPGSLLSLLSAHPLYPSFSHLLIFIMLSVLSLPVWKMTSLPAPVYSIYMCQVNLQVQSIHLVSKSLVASSSLLSKSRLSILGFLIVQSMTSTCPSKYLVLSPSQARGSFLFPAHTLHFPESVLFDSFAFATTHPCRKLAQISKSFQNHLLQENFS